MAAIQVEQSTIEMMRQMPIDAKSSNVAQMADAMSKIMPIITRMAEISNMHGTAIGAHDSGMRTLESNTQNNMKTREQHANE